MRQEKNSMRIQPGLFNGLFIFVFLAFLSGQLHGQNYGLQFSGHELPLNERTELYLTPEKPLQFDNSFQLSFDFGFQPNLTSYFGYIYRIVIGSKSIDFMHGFLPDTENNFQLIFNNQPSNITFPIPLETLTSGWVHFEFRIDLDAGTIACILEDTTLVDQIEGYDTREGLRIFFGAHEFNQFTTTDVAQMKIRDISLRTDNAKEYAWPLKQSSGDVVIEEKHRHDGWVKNPNWLLNLHANWKMIAQFELDGLAQSAFNQEEDLLYIGTSTALLTLDLIDNSISKENYAEPFKVLSSNTMVYDSTRERLVSYSIDQNYKSVYDPASKTWSVFPEDTMSLTHYWHHNNFIHPDGDLYLFGGYGNFNYKNKILRSAPGASGFDTVSYTGEFYPRYLAATAYSEENERLYILGGYGSKSGQQTVSPDYYYELLEYSFEDSSFLLVYDCSEDAQAFCFANSAVIHQQQLYALAFSKYQFDNTLQLIHIDLQDPAIDQLGSAIDFRFIDIQSNVELYFSKVSKKLIAVTSYLHGNKTELNVYTIAFPPQESIDAKEAARSNGPGWFGNVYVYILLLLLLLTGGLVWWIIRSKRKKANTAVAEDAVKIVDSSKFKFGRKESFTSSIILFGGFQVIDKEGNDITGSFTQLLKRLLLFIMLYSLKNNKGVSSQIISETFWFDKSDESARNNRAVNIVKIKSLLDKVGKMTISKDTGYWKFEYDPDTIYIDYADYLEIIRKEGKLTREDIISLLKIIDRGQFLLNTDADWLDSYKAQVSNDIIDKLADYIESSESEPDFILHLTNCMFTFDNASEEAMILQCRTLFKLGKHSLAKKSYAKFVKEYRTLYDEEYKRSFSDILDAGNENTV